ncbi:hypothetical protein, partial [uncultured Legionella sp.]|uniref:hypothetical protein n=1 Tax=uncultured Legionella sp. TaxID=210934 RepID=UPI002635C77F
ERYIFDEHIQWLDKISNKDKLVEAIKWFQWYEAHASLVDFQAYWREIARLASNYRTVINNDRYKAAFLCYALERINLDLRQLSQTMAPDLFVSQYMDLAGGIECFRDIVELAWSLNNNQLPPQCSLIATNEMAIILEARHEYKQAEYLYRQAYTLDANHPIHQYNLANILLLQNKNKTERISLFLDAARQGCEDSIKLLFKVLVIERDGTIDQLEQLKDVFESFDFDFGLDVPTPSTLLINMIIMTIYQQLTNKEIIKWRPCERDGKKSVEAIFTFEEENLDIGASSSESPDSSSVGPFASSSIEATGRDEITDTKEKNTAESTSTNSFRLFQPVKKENKPFDARKERALCKLHDLNSKPVKSLCLKDLIQAKKAYQTLMGESGGVELSHKGKTSGSRAKVGDMNMHLTHGRDRMSIGAQSEIKDTIQRFCSRIGKM